MDFHNERQVLDELHLQVKRLKPAFGEMTLCLKNLLHCITTSNGLKSNNTHAGKEQSARIAVLMNIVNHLIFYTKNPHDYKDATNLSRLQLELYDLRRFKPTTHDEARYNVQSQYIPEEFDATEYGLGHWYDEPAFVQEGLPYFLEESYEPTRDQDAKSYHPRREETRRPKIDWDAQHLKLWDTY
jgi:hypothetical protein